MRSQELRRASSTFSCASGHVHLPSATLIPDEMSTTLFTIAGMEQFVPVFLGEQPAPAPRAVTVQRCLRVAGAKSDIENVGRTGRHGTFLEMLGNFRFGDYYKREAIAWAWEFVDQRSGSSIRRSSTSRFTLATTKRKRSGARDRAPALAHHRASTTTTSGRWARPARAVPCTEIFYDTGAGARVRRRTTTAPNNGNRFVEIWNVVFQQYNRAADGTLERSSAQGDRHRRGVRAHARASCNGEASMYETDLFTDLVAAQPPIGAHDALAGRAAVAPPHHRRSRARVTFLINDGVYPSNTDRGFVLRFLIRRAIRNGRCSAIPTGSWPSCAGGGASLDRAIPSSRARLNASQHALRARRADLRSHARARQSRCSTA